MSDRQAFSDALDELETARADLEGMLDPAPGWEWAHEPRRNRGSCAAAGGVVANTLRTAGREGPDGVPGPAGLAITIAQGGSRSTCARKCRPVAYDRDGRRYVFQGGSSCSIGSNEEDYWVSGGSHRLHGDVLREEDIAFLGIEIEERKADADGPA